MRRLNSESGSTKSEPFLKFSIDCEKILSVLEEGPCRYSELIRKTKIPKGNIDRRLKHLKRIGRITSIKRKWVLVAHVKPYKNIYEYRIHLEHSWQLVKGMLAINEFLPQFVPRHDFYMGDILTKQKKRLKLRGDPEMFPYALQHIRSGYPDIFNLFEKCTFLLNLLQETEAANARENIEKFAKEFPDTQSEDVNGNLTAAEVNNVNEKSKSTLLLTEDERFKLEEQAAEARFELEEQLAKLVLKVVNGEPLGGNCKLCPTVDISERSESL